MKKFVKNTQGFSELVSTVIGLFCITCMLIISITFVDVVNEQVTLNEFSNQMIDIICDVGDINSSEIIERFDELKTNLGIDAEIEITGSSDGFYDGKIQYGDTITVTLTSEYEINLLGIYSTTKTFSITKTGRSQIYWK